MFLYLNFLFITLYFISIYIERFFGFSIPINIIGIFYLLFITPYNLIKIFKTPPLSKIEKYFSYLVMYFFVNVPIYYFANTLFDFKISVLNIFIVNVLLFVFSALIQWIRKKFDFTPSKSLLSKKIFKFKINVNKNLVLIIGIGFYLIVHAINYYFYKFMPEWDGYSDLLKIGNVIKTGILENTYRGFFETAIAVLSLFSHTSPYQIFTFWMILLQSSLLLVIYGLMNAYAIKNTVTKIIILLCATAIPTINMEIDMTRPQNIFIIFFPVYIYFLYRAFVKKSYFFWIISTFIAIFGINYHEFFIFIFFVHLATIFLLFSRRYLFSPQEKNDRIIFFLTICIGILLTILVATRINFIVSVFLIAEKITTNFTDISKWHWWFIDSYSSGDGNQMGWPGITGTMEYYGYYMSPVIAIIIFTIATIIRKKEIRFFSDQLVKITSVFFIIFITYAEILPRFNYIFIPERLWLLIDITLFIILVPIFKIIENYKTKKYILYMLLFVIALIIGTGGSFYIAQGKKALISPKEYDASQWIKKNTESDAIFLTQSANGPMINYFSERKAITPDESYFLSNILIDEDLSTLKKTLTNENILFKEKEILFNLTNDFLKNIISEEIYSKEIKKHLNEIASLDKKNKVTNQKPIKNFYILYSMDKFESIYAQREWWKKANFYGANLDKFNKAYPLMYSKDGIFIWKITK